MSVDVILNSIDQHAAAVQRLREELTPAISEAAAAIVRCLKSGGKLLLCGNGGSAADAQHIAAEFVGRYIAERRALPAIALTTDTSTLTAIANDYGYDQVFSRQVQALGRRGDILVAITTSGCSPNVLAAVHEARTLGLFCIGLLGRNGGKLRDVVDLPLVVPATDTARIQECHGLIGHLLCAAADAELLPATV